MEQKRNDIFHFSLNEIAFILILFLILLLGIMGKQLVFDGGKIKNLLEEKHTLLEKNENLTRKVNEYVSLIDENGGIEYLQLCKKFADDSENLESTKERLKQANLGQQITKAWETKNKNRISSSAMKDIMDAVRHIADNEKLVKESQLRQLAEENKKLNNQLNESNIKYAKLDRLYEGTKNRNIILEGKVGFGLPPCWLSRDGKVQYIFNVQTLPNDRVIVTPAWPEERSSEVAQMEGIQQVKAYFGKEVPMSQFLRAADSILALSKKQNPECRHFVKYRTQIPDTKTAISQRLKIENRFYKLEIN